MARHLSMQAAREDRSERAMFDGFLIANDFREDLHGAHSVAKAIQIKERIAAVVADLASVENEALKMADTLTDWGM